MTRVEAAGVYEAIHQKYCVTSELWISEICVSRQGHVRLGEAVEVISITEVSD
jgi:hypothetical protein